MLGDGGGDEGKEFDRPPILTMEMQNYQGPLSHLKRIHMSTAALEPTQSRNRSPPLENQQIPPKKPPPKRVFEPGCKRRYSGLNCKENRPTYSHYTTPGRSVNTGRPAACSAIRMCREGALVYLPICFRRRSFLPSQCSSRGHPRGQGKQTGTGIKK